MTTTTKYNLVIADEIGWTHFENKNTMAMGGHWVGYPPVGAIVGKKEPIPPFMGDLNCCYIFEKWLLKKSQREPTDKLWSEYRQNLECIAGVCLVFHAKPEQRCEAFARTTERLIDIMADEFAFPVPER